MPSVLGLTFIAMAQRAMLVSVPYGMAGNITTLAPRFQADSHARWPSVSTSNVSVLYGK